MLPIEHCVMGLPLRHLDHHRARASSRDQELMGGQVKDYVTRQWTKILMGRVSLADFIFAKEVPTAPPYAAYWTCAMWVLLKRYLSDSLCHWRDCCLQLGRIRVRHAGRVSVWATQPWCARVGPLNSTL